MQKKCYRRRRGRAPVPAVPAEVHTWQAETACPFCPSSIVRVYRSAFPDVLGVSKQVASRKPDKVQETDSPEKCPSCGGGAASKLEKGRRAQHPARTSSRSRRFPGQFQPPGMLRCLLTLSLSEPRAGRRVSQVARRPIEDIPSLRGVYCVAGRKYMKKFIDFKRYKLKARPHTRVSRVLLRG